MQLCTSPCRRRSCHVFVQRREALGLEPGDTDPALEELSDEEYQFEEEPAELKAARERLAAFTPRQGEEEPTGEEAPALCAS